MHPDDRRRAIVAAVVPLLGECGANVTTRQIAAAAGVAEGTIFRAFPDKNSVICEAVRHAMDPGPTLDRLAAIDPALPLEHQMGAAVEALIDRGEQMAMLMGVLRAVVMANPPTLHDKPRALGPPDFLLDAHAAIVGALTGFFRRQRDRIRIDPSRAALALHSLAAAAGHVAPAGTDRLTVDEIVEVAVHGLVMPTTQPATEVMR